MHLLVVNATTKNSEWRLVFQPWKTMKDFFKLSNTNKIAVNFFPSYEKKAKDVADPITLGMSYDDDEEEKEKKPEDYT